MSEDLKKEFGQFADPVFVRSNLDSFDESLREIIEDSTGDDALEFGTSVLGFLAELIEADFDSGMNVLRVVFRGYPFSEAPHSDLILPFFDVISTSQLWNHGVDKLEPRSQGTAETILNVYLRWYLTAMEFGRQLLVFAFYCHSIRHGLQFSRSKYLLLGKAPTSALEELPRGKILCNLYRPAYRHAIAHGNAVILPPHKIVLRFTNHDKDEFGKPVNIREQTVLSFKDGVDEVVEDLQRYIEPVHQGARVFYTLLMSLVVKHSAVIESCIGNVFDDEITGEVIQAINADPDGARKWQAL